MFGDECNDMKRERKKGGEGERERKQLSSTALPQFHGGLEIVEVKFKKGVQDKYSRALCRSSL